MDVVALYGDVLCAVSRCSSLEEHSGPITEVIGVTLTDLKKPYARAKITLGIHGNDSSTHLGGFIL
jgi:hypothetical protein